MPGPGLKLLCPLSEVRYGVVFSGPPPWLQENRNFWERAFIMRSIQYISAGRCLCELTGSANSRRAFRALAINGLRSTCKTIWLRIRAGCERRVLSLAINREECASGAAMHTSCPLRVISAAMPEGGGAAALPPIAAAAIAHRRVR
jgi:hypothetical protein